jgi:hypothetical protein
VFNKTVDIVKNTLNQTMILGDTDSVMFKITPQKDESIIQTCKNNLYLLNEQISIYTQDFVKQNCFILAMDDDDFNIKFFAPKDKKKCYI